MNTHDPVGLLFGGMEKLGPGGNAHTLHVLRLLPKQQFRVVVDAGCGTGRQTMALAKELGTLVAISEPAWKTKPSWYLVATDDRMIPPPAQRLMSKRAGSTVVEVAGSHAIYVSQPNAVAALIKEAAKEVTEAAN